MYWHAELTLDFSVLTAPGKWFKLKELALRGYEHPGGYQAHDDFVAVVKVYVFGSERRAFLQAALRKDGGRLRKADYRDIAKLLLEDFDVVLGTADRGGDTVEFDAARWARAQPTAAAL